jgi:hypothetical protein
MPKDDWENARRKQAGERERCRQEHEGREQQRALAKLLREKAEYKQRSKHRRNGKTFGHKKEIPRGVAKLPNLGPIVEKPEVEPELPYCPPQVKAIQPAPRQFNQPVRAGKRGFVSDAEWRYRHWCDRVLDEDGQCEYCESRNNLTAVAHPGVGLDVATMESLCVICADCIMDHLPTICCELPPENQEKTML